jgi:heat shock protein HslJ
MVTTALATALATAGGCAGDEVTLPGGGDSDEGLVGRTFLSEAVTDAGVPKELVAETRISLEFADDGELRANAGCNILFTEVTIEADRLETTGVGGTEMGCGPDLGAQDEWLVGFLESSPAWVLDGDRLTLTAGETELVLLDRRVADPDRPLEGTRWVVDAIITGDAASSMVAGTEGSAWLVIEDGTLRASSGCRDIEGLVAIEDGRLRFTEAVQTDPTCPPELTNVDDVMQTVLDGEVTYSIQASRLQLDHPDAVGLTLLAEE